MTDIAKIIAEIIRDTVRIDTDVQIDENSDLSKNLEICGMDFPIICDAINDRFGTSLDARTDKSKEYMRTVGTLVERVFKEIKQS